MGCLPEAQVGDGAGAGLLGVVDEVALGEVVRGLADDLDRVLVRPDRTVSAQAVEDGPVGAGMLGGVLLVVGQAGVGQVVLDAHGEVVARALLLEVVQDGAGHARVELAGAQAVAPAHDARPAGQLQQPLLLRLADGGTHVLVERLAKRARLLGAVQHRDRLHGGGQRPGELLHAPGAEQPHLDQADLLPLLHQVADHLFHAVRARAHHHHHPLGVRGAHVVEEPVGAAGEGREAVHRLLHDRRGGQVVAVHRLAGGEVGIRVLGGAADDGAVGTQAPGAVGAHQLLVDHGPHRLLG